MKIITEHGQLELPEDFSIKIERHNPLLSGEGDASVPATLPSSSHNLAVLGHRERVDRAYRYTNKMDAILQVGPITKRGQLILDTIHRKEGIDASFAMDNSDLYVTSKEKSLKEIFASYKRTLGSVQNAIVALESVYNGYSNNEDYMVFPVAVSPIESSGTKNKTYQYNNEISNGHLVYEQREVWEGDIKMTVPKGYGISPFIRIHSMLYRLFRLLGYEVTYNCFAKNDLKDLVLVNNCADTMITGTLHYADMVPSCTLSEFLEWLNNKFHAQPFVNSETKEVKIVMMEDVLSGEADIDISSIMEDDLSVTLSSLKHIVLKPNNSIEDTKPAAESFDQLVEDYGGFYVKVDEEIFQGLINHAPSIGVSPFDCLIQRISTGHFYVIFRDLNDTQDGYGNFVLVPLGSSNFVYDRHNEGEEESYDQEDVMPLMLFDHKTSATAPFIGERIHFHTGYNGQEEDDKQEIICLRGYCNPTYFESLAYKTSGTNQPYLQTSHGGFAIPLPFGLTPFDLYDYFWHRYNNILLNNITKVKGKVRFNTSQFMGLDMSQLKLYKNQKLLPVQASADIGSKTGATEAEFAIVNDYIDSCEDEPPMALNISPLRWEIENDASTAQGYYNENIAYNRWDYQGGVQIHEWTQYISGTFEWQDDLGLYWMGVPKEEGETHTIQRQSQISGTYMAYRKVGSASSTYEIKSFSHDGAVTITFKAVPNE